MREREREGPSIGIDERPSITIAGQRQGVKRLWTAAKRCQRSQTQPTSHQGITSHFSFLYLVSCSTSAIHFNHDPQRVVIQVRLGGNRGGNTDKSPPTGNQKTSTERRGREPGPEAQEEGKEDKEDASECNNICATPGASA